MKKIFLTLLIFATGFTFAQHKVKKVQPSPSSKLTQIVGITKVSIDYSRPSKKGRTIFGKLVPYNKVWRTGANKNTIISFSDDVTIDGKTLAAGEYALYTRPSENSWDVMFYSDADNWGTPKKWKEENVAASIKVIPSTTNKTESFSIYISDLNDNGATLNIVWDTVKVSVPFKVPTDKIVLDSIEKTMLHNPQSDDYYNASIYYLNQKKNLNQAYEWMNKALETTKNKDAYWMYYQKARLANELNKTKEALQTAEKSISIAKEKGNDHYVSLNEELIAGLK